jgi:hypothetical protein
MLMIRKKNGLKRIMIRTSFSSIVPSHLNYQPSRTIRNGKVIHCCFLEEEKLFEALETHH